MLRNTLIAVSVWAVAAGAALAHDGATAARGAEAFIGLSGGEVTDRLGEPALAAKEPPAQMWRYSLEDCTLYLFLYPRDGENAVRVTHAEIALRDGARIEPRACLTGGARTPARHELAPATAGD